MATRLFKFRSSRMNAENESYPSVKEIKLSLLRPDVFYSTTVLNV